MTIHERASDRIAPGDPVVCIAMGRWGGWYVSDGQSGCRSAAYWSEQNRSIVMPPSIQMIAEHAVISGVS